MLQTYSAQANNDISYTPPRTVVSSTTTFNPHMTIIIHLFLCISIINKYVVLVHTAASRWGSKRPSSSHSLWCISLSLLYSSLISTCARNLHPGPPSNHLHLSSLRSRPCPGPTATAAGGQQHLAVPRAHELELPRSAAAAGTVAVSAARHPATQLPVPGRQRQVPLANGERRRRRWRQSLSARARLAPRSRQQSRQVEPAVLRQLRARAQR